MSVMIDQQGRIMTDKPPITHARKNSLKNIFKKPFSSNLLIVFVAASAALGFLAGTYSNQIMSVIAPVFGQKVYGGEVDLSSVEATYRALKANFDGNLSDETLIEGANRGLVNAAGDQYTLFMNASESTSFANDLTGNIGGGIGAEVGKKNDQLYIVRVLKSNPAEKAGLLAGDVLVSVNDQSTSGWTIDQTVAQIRGQVGTTVKLSTKRGEEVKDYTITRETITNPSVDASVKDGIGILTVSRFDNETASLARAAAQDFKNQGVKGVILDLRGNGGGYVDAAQDLAGLWLDNKVVVVEKTGGKVVNQLKSTSNPILAGIPTVVLVNGGSASASEILAGALQDHKVAKLVGEKTFGKGSVQKLIDLPAGAQLKVTVARWYTPNGKNITKEGISPDITATLSAEDINAGNDTQLDAAKNALGL